MSAGLTFEPVKYGPLTRTDFVRYAGASGDFNPLHHDGEFARAAGLPDVMCHGMLSAGLLASAIVGWCGAGTLRRCAMRFRHPVWPGDVLVAEVKNATARTGPAAQRFLDLELVLRRGRDEVVLSATATVIPGPTPGPTQADGCE